MRSTLIFRSLWLGFALPAFLLVTGSALAQTVKLASLQSTGDAQAPIGWTQLCRDYAEDARRPCDAAPLPAKAVVLDEAKWRELLKINRDVNREVEPVTDLEHWGVLEHWDYPDDGKGDCEDYALEKRDRLLKAGWPRQSLLLTVVRDKKGEGHAILTVATDRGDFILDNQVNKVLIWSETGYVFIKRQSQESPNRWVALGHVDTQLFTAK